MKRVVTRKDVAAEVVRGGVWGIGLSGDMGSAVLLVDLLGTWAGDDAVAGSIAQAIGLLGSADALDGLLAFASPADDVADRIRLVAIGALGCLCDGAVVPRIPEMISGYHYRLHPNWVSWLLGLL
jgi:HEAT repeat protein